LIRISTYELAAASDPIAHFGPLRSTSGGVFHLLRRLAVLVSVVVPVTAAFAGDYKLTSGEELAVCRAYKRIFESRHDVTPMACERQYDMTVPGFENVEWRRLDLDKHFELYREAEVYLATNNYSPQGMVMSGPDAEDMARRLRGKANHLQVELYVATLALFGRSTAAVNVLSVRELACGPTPLPDTKISRLFVLNRDMTHIDSKKQVKLDGWYNNATIASFEGKTYIENYVPDDNWGTLLTGSGVLSVSDFSNGRFQIECRISFTPTSGTEIR
jgi:hypothetical protein